MRPVLILGRLDTGWFLGGAIPLCEESARGALRALAADLGTRPEEAAWAVIRVANANMERAVRRISVERGYDPRRFTLVAFGGGGPLHAAELAAALRIPRVLVPPTPGVLSAQDADKAKRGEAVYAEQKCSLCHSIAGKGNAKGSLDGVGKKLSAEEIKQWIVNPKEMTAIFYRPGDLKQRLQIPLGATLGSAVPPPERMGGVEGKTVDSLTLSNIFNWSVPASQIGEPALVLNPLGS